MDEIYTAEYDKEVFAKWKAYFLGSEQFKDIDVRPDNGFGNFVPRDGIRLMAMLQSDPLGEETIILEERLAKQMLKGRNCGFFMDGVLQGRMSVISDVSQDLDADQFFIENPIFLQALLNRVVAVVVEKYTPPQKDTVPEVAGAATQTAAG